MNNKLDIVTPDWPAPNRIHALTTTRIGGVSRGAYASFNLAEHVNDDPAHVAENRRRLREAQQLPAEPLWLKQVHGTAVVNAATSDPGVTADGAWTDQPGRVLAVMTADCLPIFLCDAVGTRIALLHAGWRGLADGVVEAGVAALHVPGSELLAHLGPGIGPQAYEVGEDVREAFVARDAGAAEGFTRNANGRWWADMYALARRRLHALGITQITGGEHCTLRERERFFSYRRDGATGRMASLLWLA